MSKISPPTKEIKKVKTYKSMKREANITFILFVFPALFAFSLFVIVPFVQGAYYSVTNWTGLNTKDLTFIGLDHFEVLLKDPDTIYSFFRTTIYAFLNVIIINLAAFGLATLVVQKLKFKNWARAGFFLPNLIGGLILGYIWQFIYNEALTSLGGAFARSILLDSSTAMIGLIIVVTWQYAGYIMMIYIAALQNVPQDLVEASKIDGANAWQRLKSITLPLVAQAFTIAMFLTLVTSFKQFDTVISLNGGGPSTTGPIWLIRMFDLSLPPIVESSRFFAQNIYDTAFTDIAQGLAQAKAIIFFIVLLCISLTQVYINKKREVEL